MTNLGPLAGIRVIDLGWLTAGAASSSLLLDLGADVVKIEGPGALDPFRDWTGAEADTDWWNHSPFYNFTNRGKRSICLDLKDPRGRSVIFRLLETADILVENYRRGVLESFGLDPKMLREKFPRLIIASISSQGLDGPDRDMVSFGSTLEATGGLASLTGPKDGDAAITGRNINYPDQVVCLFAAGAIVSALARRDATGKGAHLDLSQRELTSFLLGEELIATAAGTPTERQGNASRDDLAEAVVAHGQEWKVVWSQGSAPVRDGIAVAEADEFKKGSAVLRDPKGIPAKGVPFNFGTWPARISQSCAKLGAHNRDTLIECGFSTVDIDELEALGVLAAGPRRGPNR